MGDWDPNEAWRAVQVDGVEDASSAYAGVRERCPVARVDEVLGGFWAVLDHESLVQASLATSTFSNVVPFFKTRRPPLECDPPEHTFYRRLLNPYFSGERLGEMAQHLRHFALELLGPLLAARTGDFAESFSHPFPTRALCLLLDLPDGDWRLISDWSKRVDEVGGQSPPGSSERIAVGEELRPYMTSLIRRRRAHPGNDVVSGLVHGDPELEPLDDEAILGIVMMLITAGHNTTTSAIGNAVLRLARDATLQERLRREPALIPALVEESIRIDAPQQAMRRIAASDTEPGGRRSRPESSSGSSSAPRTSTRRPWSGRPSSTSNGRRTGTWVSAGESISASERRSPGSRSASPSKSCSRERRRSRLPAA